MAHGQPTTLLQAGGTVPGHSGDEVGIERQTNARRTLLPLPEQLEVYPSRNETRQGRQISRRRHRRHHRREKE